MLLFFTGYFAWISKAVILAFKRVDEFCWLFPVHFGTIFIILADVNSLLLGTGFAFYADKISPSQNQDNSNVIRPAFLTSSFCSSRSYLTRPYQVVEHSEYSSLVVPAFLPTSTIKPSDARHVWSGFCFIIQWCQFIFQLLRSAGHVFYLAAFALILDGNSDGIRINPLCYCAGCWWAHCQTMSPVWL
jgi:hypothetical protein